MITKPKLRHPLLALFAGAALAATASADQAFDAASATAFIDKHAQAIVEVRLVNHIKIRLVEGPEEVADAIAQAPEEEEEAHANGIVIDPKGLVAVPCLPLYPTMLVKEVTVPTPLGEIKLALESRLADVRIITAAGTELAAEVVLADRDTGLMLVKAVERPEAGLPALAPDASQPQPSAFSPVLCLGRMTAAFGHQPSTMVVRTTGPLTARHGLDPLADAGSGALGNAVFDKSGDFLGIVVVPVGGDSANPSMNDLGLYLIPASTLHRLAKEHLN